MADDSFSVHIDGLFVCATEIGQANTCPISWLRPGRHELAVQIEEAPDGVGTYIVLLRDGWKFVDNSTQKESTNPQCQTAIQDKCYGGPGERFAWDFTVPYGQSIQTDVLPSVP